MIRVLLAGEGATELGDWASETRIGSDRSRPRSAKPLQRSVASGGGVAVEAIEAWILALLGDASCERRRDPKQVLKSRGVVEREKMVDALDGAASIEPTLSASLDRWLASVKSITS